MIRILLMFWLAWQTVSPEALQHLQAGAEAEKQRHFDVAIDEFKKATELAPTLAEAFVNLGQAYRRFRTWRRSRNGQHWESRRSGPGNCRQR